VKPANDALILRLRDGTIEEVLDEVATETRCSLYVNGERVLGFLCSPGEPDALAVGFARSEGWLEERAFLRDILVEEEGRTVRLTIDGLPEQWKAGLSDRTLSSGCAAGTTFGGKRAGSRRTEATGNLLVDAEEIRKLLRGFRERADLYQRTGGVHSAALCAAGRIEFYTEDIGRHNAVDKAIGRAFLAGRDLTCMILLCSGRLSSEMVGKAAASGIPIVISRAAPTCLSIAMAEDAGMTLIGFARGDRMNIYCHPWRLTTWSSGPK